MAKGLKLKKGEYIRVKGNVTMYAPHKKVNGIWVGGSSWTAKNPLIMIGKCKHKPKKINSYKNVFSGKRIRCKGRIECLNCGRIIKLGTEVRDSKESGTGGKQ